MFSTFPPLYAQIKTEDSIPSNKLKQLKIRESKPDYVHQVRIGADLGTIVYNFAQENRTGYNFIADYALPKNVYLNLGTGFGKGNVDYDHLKYSTQSYFIRAGVDKSLLDQLSKNDFDIAFIGAAYGLGIGQRSAASYTVPTPFGPDISGTSPQQNFVVHWGELTAGIRVELWNNIFAGWNVRARFLLNTGVFDELAPNFIAGYGKADKATSFGFNFYLCYAFRWGGG